MQLVFNHPFDGTTYTIKVFKILEAIAEFKRMNPTCTHVTDRERWHSLEELTQEIDWHLRIGSPPRSTKFEIFGRYIVSPVGIYHLDVKSLENGIIKKSGQRLRDYFN